MTVRQLRQLLDACPPDNEVMICIPCLNETMILSGLRNQSDTDGKWTEPIFNTPEDVKKIDEELSTMLEKARQV